MNVFYLDPDPTMAARYHCNRHVVKMVVEAAQLCSVVHRRLGYQGAGCYKDTRSAHPTHESVRWVSESLGNYRWTVRLGLALAAEFERRFSGREHKTKAVLMWLQAHEPAIEDLGLTPVRLAMPEQYRDPRDPVGSYRAYYRNEKRVFKDGKPATWPPGERPAWF